MKFIKAIPFIILALLSCNESASDKKTALLKDALQIRDTVVLVKDSTRVSEYPDSLFAGAYQGIFPCADCDGIQQTILFNADKTFRQEQVTWGENDIPRQSEGTWESKNGSVQLFQNNKPIMDLIIQKDSLSAININGVELNMASRYVLTKRDLADTNPIWAKKKKQGIDFAAIGTEPFWNLEIDNKKNISFKLADAGKPVTATVEKKLINKDSVCYKLSSDTTNWSVTIFPQFCNDGMSDFLYQYKVKVKFKGIFYKGCGVMLSSQKIPISL